jgi:hypothetical protein
MPGVVSLLITTTAAILSGSALIHVPLPPGAPSSGTSLVLYTLPSGELPLAASLFSAGSFRALRPSLVCDPSSTKVLTLWLISRADPSFLWCCSPHVLSGCGALIHDFHGLSFEVISVTLGQTSSAGQNRCFDP